MASDMASKVYLLLKRIPKGKVATYAEIARAAKTHPRAVGMLMRHNKDPINVPCYKVVRLDGSIGGYSGPGGIKRKAALLRADGIDVKNGRIDLGRHLFRLSKS
jgi:methylated-DNA-[protein]-cysteine S-methyltransferase